MNEKHQPNFIERMLMGIMQAVDTQTFSEKDKILFYKQLVQKVDNPHFQFHLFLHL